MEISISLISIGLTMYFTLIFEDGKEGPARIYDLVYHPCPVWMKGEEIITVPDASNPNYQIGHLEALFSTGKGDDEDYYNEPAKIFDFGLTHSTVLVCVHPGDMVKAKTLSCCVKIYQIMTSSQKSLIFFSKNSQNTTSQWVSARVHCNI